MPARRFYLTEADKAAIKAAMDRQQARRVNPSLRYDDSEGSQFRPETYVAWTGETGIPALETAGTGTGSGTGTVAGEDHPGQALLTVYQVTDDIRQVDNRPTLIRVDDHQLVVHNLSGTAVPPESWALVTRDKYGTWWAVASAGGDQGGHWVRITAVSGLKAEGVEVDPAPDGTYMTTPGGITHQFADQPLYEANDMAGAPVGAIVFVRPGDVGDDGQEWIYGWDRIPAVITDVADGSPKVYTCLERTLGVGGIFAAKAGARGFTAYERNNYGVEVGTKVWLYRGYSSATNGDLEGMWFDHEPRKASALSYTTINVADVTDYTGIDGHLYLNLFDGITYFYTTALGWIPWCCDSGGTGTGAGGGDVLTDCCPDDPLPQTLYLTLSNAGNGCEGCLDTDPIEMHWDGDGWVTDPQPTPCAPAGPDTTNYWDIKCLEGGEWKISYTGGIFYGDTPPTSASCNPFELVFDLTFAASGPTSGCPAGGTFIATISDTP